MDPKASSLAVLAVLVALSSTFTSIAAFNITKVLGNYPDLSTFNSLLTTTELAATINKRLTITILAVDNGAISSITGRPTEEIKNILMNHVVLDYYDDLKLKGMKGKSTLLTTLFQTTGVAQEQNGFVNCTKTGGGKIVFGSGVKGSPLNVEFVKVVYQQPYNLSVLQVSMPIVAPGIGAPVQAPPPPPFTPPPAAAPKASKDNAPAPAEEEDVPAPYAASPEPSAPTPEPADGPGPASGPSPAASKKPADEDTGDDAPDASATSKISFSFGAAAVMGLLASFVNLGL